MLKTFLNTPQKIIVLASACFISFVMNGIPRVFGLLFVASLSRYGATRQVTSIPFLLPYTLKNLVGPLSGYLSSKFGVRVVIGLGCLLCTLGLGVSFFVEDIYYVIVFVGVTFGVGYGFSVNLMPQVLSYHFSDHIDKANGLFHGISGIGNFVLLEITNVLLFTYGLSGTFLLLAAIALHAFPATLLLRKPKPPLESKEMRVYSMDGDKTENKSLEFSNNVEHDSKGETLSKDASMIKDNSKVELGGKHAMHDIPKPKPLLESKKRTTYSTDGDKTENEPNDVENRSNDKTLSKDSSPMNDNSKVELGGKQATRAIGITNSADKTSGVLPQENAKKPPPSHLFRVFLDPAFIIMSVWHGVSIFVFVTLWTVMVDVSVDKGSSEHQGVHIMLGSAVSEMVGRSLLGFLTDGGCISKVNFVTLSFVLLGLLFLLFVWLRGFVAILIAVCACGILTGGVVMISVGIILMYVKKDTIRMATASRFLLYTPMSFCQPYVIGFFRDTLNSYDGLFCTLAALCFFCAVMNAVTPAAARFRDRHKKNIILTEITDVRS